MSTKQNAVRVEGQYSPDVQLLNCHLYYLPRQFSGVIVVSVYIPSSTNSKNALQEGLHKIVSLHMTKQPNWRWVVSVVLIKQKLQLFYLNSPSISKSPPGEKYHGTCLCKHLWQLLSLPPLLF